jgi:hypothetical protein
MPAYILDEAHVLPQPRAAAGWNPRLQSGHLLAPLLTHLLERIPGLVPMITTRCVVDLTRPVPMKPLRWHSEVVRQGKKLQVVRSALLDGDVELASATALRARIDTSPATPMRDYPAPEQGNLLQPPLSVPGFEIRPLSEVRNGGGACVLWSRVVEPVVAGVETSPLMHAMSLADFGSGMGNALSFSEWSFPNIDIVALFFREPRGEWLLLDAATEAAGNGIGLVSGVLADREGPFARCHQTLFIDPVKRAR